MPALKYVLKREMTVVKLSPDLGSVVEVLEETVLPAGCLVESVENPAVTDDDSQIILKSLDEFNGAGVPDGTPLYTQASNDDLIEVSIFTANILKPEKRYRLRLLVCRDENWLCEAIHIVEESSVIVTSGCAVFAGIVRYVGSLSEDDSRSFGVELTFPDLEVLRELMPHATDGKPHFECQDGRGVFASITSIRLAEINLQIPFKGFKPFSARTKKASNIRAIKSGKEVAKAPSENGLASSVPHPQQATVIRPLNKDDRVVWIRDDGKSVRGTIRFVGKLKQDGKEQMAVEFEEPEGEPGFTGLTNRQAQFKIPDGYGKIMALEDFSKQLVREEDFGYLEAVPPRSISPVKVEPAPKDGRGTLRKNDRVVWFHNGEDAVRGEVRFVGSLAEKKGNTAVVERIGVLLDEPKGDASFTGKAPDGKVLFHCPKKHGILTAVDMLMLETEYNALFNVVEPEVETLKPEDPATSVSVPLQRKKGPIRVGDEVVWRDPKEAYLKPCRGIVKWFGEPGGTYYGRMYAVDFKEPVGQKGWTGKHNGEQLFTCKPDYARFVYPKDVALAKGQDNEIIKVFSKQPPQQNQPKPQKEPEHAAKVSAVAEPKNSDDWVTRHDSLGEYKINDRVLLTVSDMERLPVESKIGTLRWIGVAKRISHAYMHGVEMDHQIGSPENVLYCGFVGNAQFGYLQAFECKPGHGKIVSPSDVMKLELADIEDPRGGKANGEWTVVDYSKHHQAGPPVNQPAVTPQMVPPLPNIIAPTQLPILRATRQPTVPTAMFQVALHQRVMTYLDNQQATASVIWLGQLPGQEGDYAGLFLDKLTLGAPGFGDVEPGFGICVPVDVLHPIPAPPVHPTYFPNQQRHFLQAAGHVLPNMQVPYGPPVFQMPPPVAPGLFNQQHLGGAPPQMRPLGGLPLGFNFRGAGNGMLLQPAAPVDSRQRTASAEEVMAAVANAEVRRDVELYGEKWLQVRKTSSHHLA